MTLRSLNTQYALPTTHSAQAGETGNVQSGGTERRTYVVEHATLHYGNVLDTGMLVCRDVPKN